MHWRKSWRFGPFATTVRWGGAFPWIAPSEPASRPNWTTDSLDTSTDRTQLRPPDSSPTSAEERLTCSTLTDQLQIVAWQEFANLCFLFCWIEKKKKKSNNLRGIQAVSVTFCWVHQVEEQHEGRSAFFQILQWNQAESKLDEGSPHSWLYPGEMHHKSSLYESCGSSRTPCALLTVSICSLCFCACDNKYSHTNCHGKNAFKWLFPCLKIVLFVYFWFLRGWSVNLFLFHVWIRSTKLRTKRSDLLLLIALCRLIFSLDPKQWSDLVSVRLTHAALWALK